MTDHAALVVRRPYETADALVAGDAWVVGRTDILLVGQGAMPLKSLVAFEIALAGGEVVIRGDGWAMGNEPDDGAGTGGLRVRLRTVDKAGKPLLKRMLELQKQGLAERPRPPARIEAPSVRETPSAAETAASPAPVVETGPAPAAAETATPEPRPSDAGAAPEASSEELPSAPRLVDPPAPPDEKSGVRQRPTAPIAAPDDRNALLERLRARARVVVKAAAHDERDKAAG